MTPQLVTIPISHYCEKARWALDRAGIVYEERPHLQVFHYVAVKRAGGGISAPAMKTDDGSFGDSTDILKWIDRKAPDAGLYPRDPAQRAEVERLEDHFDEHLGPATRRIAYYHLLGHNHLAYKYNAVGCPAWQRRLQPLFLPVALLVIKQRLAISAAAVDGDLPSTRAIFCEVADRLAGGRRYLVGDRFSAADLTFAAMAAPVLSPAQYGSPLPRLDELPPGFQAVVNELRATPAGAFALRLFAEDRPCRRA